MAAPMEILRPGIEYKLQLQSTPQLQQCQVLLTHCEEQTHISTATWATAVRFLIHFATMGTLPELYF